MPPEPIMAALISDMTITPFRFFRQLLPVIPELILPHPTAFFNTDGMYTAYQFVTVGAKSGCISGAFTDFEQPRIMITGRRRGGGE